MAFVALLNDPLLRFITRSPVAALLISGTVAFSYAGRSGSPHSSGSTSSACTCTGSSYRFLGGGRVGRNLLLIKPGQRDSCRVRTGLIRALGSTGGLVTSAGLVFAFTMLAMLTSDLRTIGQVGSTVCIGLLLDTLIVRSFVVPCILRILGPWFRWSTLVRSRPLREGYGRI